MKFSDPLMFLLIPVVPIYVYWCIYKTGRGALKFSSITQAKNIKPTRTIKFRNLPVALRGVSLLVIIISMARPQKGTEPTKIPTEGIAIILALDVSTSMLAEDFTVAGKRDNRLAAAKEVVKEFISRRDNDQIGMVVFAGRPYTQCPLTIDYGILLQLLDNVKIGMVEDGTAIGSAIITALNRFKNIPAKSKIVILLTDGCNNMGKIDPLTSAEMAHALGVKVYTIGAGSKGMAPYPVLDFFGDKRYQNVPVDIDEDTLKKIADTTSGMYFRATDTKSLEEIYKEIDKMEKTKTEIKMYMEYKELFPYFLLPGFGLLIIEVLVSNTWLRKMP